MAQLVGCIVSQGDAPVRPNDWSLLYNDRARVPVGDYLIGVNDHAESPTVAKRDNLNTLICAGQLGNSRSRSSGSDQEGDTRGCFAEELVEGSRLDQKSSLAGVNPKGVKLANHEDSPRITRGNHIEEHIKGNDNCSLGYYEIYIIIPQLKEGLGVALIDTGSHVSLVKESSLTKFSKEKYGNVRIYGITGK
jgi:hypothetical protein